MFTRLIRNPVIAVLHLLILFLPQAGGDEATAVRTFLERYCVDCHHEDDPAGQREFSAFRLPLNDPPSLISADEIIDQLTLGAMPPAEAEQPEDAERLLVLERLRGAIRDARDQGRATGGHTVLRRLTHREYENTLAVLFDRRVDTLGLTADFPRENSGEGSGRVGADLVTSGFLLDQYFQAANRLVEQRLGKPATESREWHFRDHFVQYEELSGPHRAVFNYDFLCLYEQPNTDTRQGGYGHIEDFLQGVPVSGRYEIQVLVRAMHRDTHYDPKIFRIDFSEPFQLAVVPGDVTKGHIHYPQAIEPILAGPVVVPDDEFQWLTLEVWLDAGQTPRFIFPNGPYESRASVISVNEKYHDEFNNKSVRGVSRSEVLRHGKLPHIRIDEVKIRGPLPEPEGTREELAVFGPDGFQEEQATEQLFAFARRAYRRPLQDEDRHRIQSLYELQLSQASSPRQAALDAVKLILCSPSFLYLGEQTAAKDNRLNAHDLAARLSYTLWGAPPDGILSELADRGKLLDEGVLREQIHRLLTDERKEYFIRGFAAEWLSLDAIGSHPPPRRSAWQYYSEALPDSMRREVWLYLSDLLERDESVFRLLHSDYTFVDKKLAKLYDLRQKETLRLADGFQRVTLQQPSRRGGLLGMAAVLTVSANGVETSPVTRGVWVLEHLLGSPPPPPPDDVPAIDADVSGATTIRQRLDLHSEDAACRVCHQKIDPMGFALESFDPIGRYRSRYPKPNKGEAPAIDASGRFPDGTEYSDFGEFRQLLLETRQEAFVRHLTKELLIYSTGRYPEPVDRLEIDAIVQRAMNDQAGFRSLVIAVLTSDIFCSR